MRNCTELGKVTQGILCLAIILAIALSGKSNSIPTGSFHAKSNFSMFDAIFGLPKAIRRYIQNHSEAREFINTQEIDAKLDLETCQDEVEKMPKTREFFSTFGKSHTGRSYGYHFNRNYDAVRVKNIMKNECQARLAKTGREQTKYNFMNYDFDKVCGIRTKFVDCAHQLRSAYEGGSGRATPTEPNRAPASVPNEGAGVDGSVH
jgi:hypothetical protein